MIKKLIVIFFFLFLPIIGILLHVFTQFLHLSQWEIINIIVSVIFSVLFVMKQYLLSKTLGALLVTSIVSKNAYLLLESSDEITTAIMQVGFVIVYQAAWAYSLCSFFIRKLICNSCQVLLFAFIRQKTRLDPHNSNFNKKGARNKHHIDGSTTFTRKDGGFKIELNGKTLTYGKN